MHRFRIDRGPGARVNIHRNFHLLAEAAEDRHQAVNGEAARPDIYAAYQRCLPFTTLAGAVGDVAGGRRDEAVRQPRA